MNDDTAGGEKFDPRFHQRVIRPFISSTFRDMQQERDLLVKSIFPQLRKRCQERAAVFTEVDLRWGITTEQVAEKKVLQLCFEEIDRSLPYFVGLLGQRYGSVPDPATIPPHLFESQEWLQQFPQASVTELEMQHAVLQKSLINGRAYFYFRDPGYFEHMPEEEQIIFQETDAASLVNLERLKKKIREASNNNFCKLRENYQTPEQLGEWILEDFSTLIDELYPLRQLPDRLRQEALNHETYAESLRFAFVGRNETLRLLNTKAESEGGPVVLTGEPGCGKSALLAEWVCRWRSDHQNDFIIQHYISATPQSGKWQELVRRIAGELQRVQGLAENIPVKDNELMDVLEKCFAGLAAQRIVLILDGVDQLAGDMYALQLEWLPRIFPQNFIVFISGGDGESLKVLKHRGYPIVSVPVFTREEVIEAIDEFFRLYGNRRLPANVISEVSSVDNVRNPLFLRAVLDELRQFGRVSELNNTAHEYLSSQDLQELFCKIIKRWDHDFGSNPGCADMVKKTLCLLTCSRLGLSESEVLELLGSGQVPLPRRFWTPFFLAAESSLSMSSGLLTINHRYLRAAIYQLWSVASPQEVSTRQWATQMFSSEEFHKQLAAYFERRDTSPRKIRELLWQYQETFDWQPFFDLLQQWSRHPPDGLDKAELQLHWQSAELELRQINSRFLNMPSLFQKLLATCLFHRTMELTGENKYQVAKVVIDEAITLLRVPEHDMSEARDRRLKLAMALAIKTGIMAALHNFKEADNLLVEQQQISEELNDKTGLAVVKRLRETVEKDRLAYQQYLSNVKPK